MRVECPAETKDKEDILKRWAEHFDSVFFFFFFFYLIIYFYIV